MTESELPTPAEGNGHDRRTEDDVRQLVRTIVIELGPERNEQAGRDAALVADLGYHSLAMIEMAFTLEDEFDLPPIEEAIARRITTISGVEDHVVAELAARGALGGGR